MAELSVGKYLNEVAQALEFKDGARAAKLLSFKDKHVLGAQLQLENAQDYCQRVLYPPIDELFAAHLRGIWAVSNKDFVGAYACQAVAVQSFVKAFQSQKDENWSLPIMKCLVLDLRLFALRVSVGERGGYLPGRFTSPPLFASTVSDDQLCRSGRGKSGETLERAAEVMMACFRVCAADSRAAIDVSKKWGMLTLVNHLFKVYFKINRIHLCKPLIRAIDSLNIKDQFEISSQVTYKYYVGRKAMFDNDLKLADEYLSFAFKRCHRKNTTNKRLVLIYLVPVKMLEGRLPTEYLLKKYNLPQYIEIVNAVRTGNLLLLNKMLEKHELFLINYGVFLILEKLKLITYRNLFKKVYLLLQTHLIPLPAFVSALHYVQIEDMDVIEVQCIVANLIFQGYIKGYISHQHQKLVVSKQNPFPALTTFLGQG